jgi:hypothetical protein
MGVASQAHRDPIATLWSDCSIASLQEALAADARVKIEQTL